MGASKGGPESQSTIHVVLAQRSPAKRARARLELLARSDRYTFVEAATAQSAVHAVYATPDAVSSCLLLDERLPDADAQQVLAHLTDRDGMCRCPVVVLTRQDPPMAAVGLLRAGAHELLAEDRLASASLPAAIDQAIERHRMTRAHVGGGSAVGTATHELRRGTAAAWLQQVIRIAGVGLWEWDPATNTIDWSDTMWALHGRSHAPDLDLYEVFCSTLHPDDHARVIEDIGAHLASDARELRVEYRVVLPDGTARWLESIGEILRDPDGQPIHMLGLDIDLTVRKHAEAAVRHSESFHRQMIESIPGIVFTNTPDGACDYVSEPWVDLTGIPAADNFGDGWMAALHPDDRASALAAWRAAVASGGPYDVEYRVRRASGAYEWLKVRGRAIRDARGVVVRWFGAAVSIDGLKQAQAALVAREQELQALADHTPDILTRFDRQLRHVFVNAAIEKATGLTPAELLGKTNRELGMPAEHCDRWDAVILAVFEQREPQTLEFSFEAPDGLRWYSARFVPELGPDGEVAFALGVTHDVTDARRAQLALEEADRRKDEFLATLAHELRNPLAPIRTGLELLRRSTATDELTSRLQDIMERQLGHLVRLVDDLLDVSRIGHGKVELVRERIRVRTVLEHAVEASRPLVEASGHALVVRAPATPLWVDADLTRLAQVIGNLLNNAAKYTPRGGHIELEARAEGRDAMISVTDDGAGISAGMLPRVFDLFAQVDRTRDRAQGGLGIGLSLVRTLVELHGGTVDAHSRGLGHGSTFTIRLPLAIAMPQDAASDQRPRDRARTAPHRILVVDDNVDGAETLAALLRVHGHEVATAHDGPAALAAARAFRPEVVLLDLGLPRMDGYAVARQLQAEPHTAGAVLVALTGWGTEDDERTSLDAGFAAHLTKPIDPTTIANVLAQVWPSDRG